MIKFIVLFSLALAGHKARGLMLRGSGQILQRPNFINSESQLDAKKSFLQINKNNGKSLLKKASHLHHNEDKQEQSYLQGRKKEEKKIKSSLERTKREFNPHEIYKGLNFVTFKHYTGHDVVDRLVQKVASDDSEEGREGLFLLRILEDLSKAGYSKDDLKDLSTRILYLVDGREKSIKDQLARIREEGNAEKIDKGLSRMRLSDEHYFWHGYQQLQYLTKLVNKRKTGKTLDKKKAQDCINKLSEFGSREPGVSEIVELRGRIKSLVDSKSRK